MPAGGLQQQLRAAELVQQLAAAAARDEDLALAVHAGEVRQPAAAGGRAARRPGRTRRTGPSPYDAFSTLQPETVRPSSTRAATPTGKPEYGAYARDMASRAAARSASQSTARRIRRRRSVTCPGPSGTACRPPWASAAAGRTSERTSSVMTYGVAATNSLRHLVGQGVPDEHQRPRRPRGDHRPGTYLLADSCQTAPSDQRATATSSSSAWTFGRRRRAAGGVGVAEQAGAHGEPARPPVAEDHRGEADVAAAAGLALQVDVRGDDGEEDAAEAGQAAGDDHGDVLVLVDVDAERLGGDRVLAAGPQPQAEGGAPQHPPGGRDAARPRSRSARRRR